MSDGTWGFIVVALLVISMPLLTVATFALERRYPEGLIKRHQRWVLFAAIALIQLALGIGDLVSGAKPWRTALALGLAATFACLAIHHRGLARSSTR